MDLEEQQAPTPTFSMATPTFNIGEPEMKRHFIGTPTAAGILNAFLDYDDADIANEGPPLDFDEAMTKFNTMHSSAPEQEPQVPEPEPVKVEVVAPKAAKSIGIGPEECAGVVVLATGDECDSSGSTWCGLSETDCSPIAPGRPRSGFGAEIEEEDSDEGEDCDEEYESDFESESEYSEEESDDAEEAPDSGGADQQLPADAGSGRSSSRVGGRARSSSRSGPRPAGSRRERGERSSSRTGSRAAREGVPRAAREGGGRSSSCAGSRPQRAGSRTRGPKKEGAPAVFALMKPDRPRLTSAMAETDRAAMTADLIKSAAVFAAKLTDKKDEEPESER